MGIIYKNGIPYGNQPNGTVPSGGTTGQVLKKVSNTDYDTEWANESGGGGGTSDIAEEYDPISGVYSVGDYCIYQTVLYKCITAISTPEAFDSTKWSEVTVGDELNGVKNTLNQLDAEKADEDSLALRRSGATNAGAQIETGTFFYLDGTLKHAIATIAQNASFTAQNCETVTAGGLNSLSNTIKNIVKTDTTTITTSGTGSASVGNARYVIAANTPDYDYLAIPVRSQTNYCWVKILNWDMTPVANTTLTISYEYI